MKFSYVVQAAVLGASVSAVQARRLAEGKGNHHPDVFGASMSMSAQQNMVQLDSFGGSATFAAATKPATASASASATSSKGSKQPSVTSAKASKSKAQVYEVWGADQSNSEANVAVAGTKGGFIWVWNSTSIHAQLSGGLEATPLSCSPGKSSGPCNLLDVFPQGLVDGSGTSLGTLPAFGRLHGFSKDPTNMYITANIFAPQGGYVGVIHTETKGAIALFRVTKTNANANQRSVHMSFWTADGSAIIVSNLDGKMIERIDVARDTSGKIIDLVFNTNAGVYLGSDFTKVESATVFSGVNAFGENLIGSISGDYSLADTGNLTPAGKYKEWNCASVINAAEQPQGGCRPNNVPICPLPSFNKNVYVTLGGGGLFVIKSDTTPMKIVGEYTDRIVNGAGCGGVEAQGKMFINAGVAASGAGFEQSTFTVYAFDDAKYDAKAQNPEENSPFPALVFKDKTNTNTLGNIDGTIGSSNNSGQLPATTLRRDSHGGAATIDGKYVHFADRIQNIIEVFDAATYERVSTYDLVSSNGKSGRQGPAGTCLAKSVLDDRTLQLNDPAPDLMELTPDGKYLMVAFRGPVPVSVSHSAQGSCPGVGIVELLDNGKSGKLVDILRSTNMVDNVSVGNIVGGTNYTGTERSDVHSAIVVAR